MGAALVFATAWMMVKDRNRKKKVSTNGRNTTHKEIN
jgi:hypothetical protein